jgi:serine phosphatase RsbU (regulator of sigma subunit)
MLRAFSWITCPARAQPCRTGGDIACAVTAPGAIRLLIGDVMGHGVRAARTARAVTRAFREYATCADPLQVIAMRLHAFVAARDDGEEFVTALLVTVPMGGDADVEIVSCGHPQPLMLRAGRATLLDEIPPALPLGLLDMAGCQPRSGRLGVGPGDSLLLYTDGVTDARDPSGRSYPLAERAAALSREDGPLLGALRADLMRHAAGVLRDDATMLHLRLAGTAAGPASQPARYPGSPQRADAESFPDFPQRRRVVRIAEIIPNG